MDALEVIISTIEDESDARAVANADGELIWTNATFDTQSGGMKSLEQLPDPAVVARLFDTMSRGERFENICNFGRLRVYPVDQYFLVRMEPSPLLFKAFRKLAQSVPENIMVLDDQGVCVWANRPETQYAIGKTVADFAPPEVKDAAVEKFYHCLQTGEAFKSDPKWVVATDGVKRCYRAQWVPIEEDGRRFLCIVAIDVTEHVNDQEQLRESEERYRTLLHNSLDVICMYSADLTLRYITPNVVDHLGFEAEELVGKNLLDFVGPEEIREILTKVEEMNLNSDLPQTVETRVRRRDGDYSTMEARIRRVEAQGETLIFVNARDISARRELEQMRQNLLRADKLASIGQLAAGVAHEINNPSAFISTNLFVLKEYAEKFIEMNRDLADFALKLDAEDREYYLNYLHENEIQDLLEDMIRMVDTNLEGMDRISHIVRELRLFSREGTEEAEVFDLNSAVETASSIVKNQISPTGKLVVAFEDLPLVVGHKGKITQVLVNLLVNAAHAVSQSTADRVVKVRTTTNQDCIVVEVSDTGPGIPEKFQNQIFEPFFTTKTPEQGTGLGLWLCKEIMKQSKGAIEFETSPQGTTFRLKFQPMPRPGQTAEVEAISGHRVLLIGQDLKKEGLQMGHKHGCVSTDSVDSAVEILKTDRDFDLVIASETSAGADRTLARALERDFPSLHSKVVWAARDASVSEMIQQRLG